jgi:hypothetical protein
VAARSSGYRRVSRGSGGLAVGSGAEGLQGNKGATLTMGGRWTGPEGAKRAEPKEEGSWRRRAGGGRRVGSCSKGR